jgi:hypothetical protein
MTKQERYAMAYLADALETAVVPCDEDLKYIKIARKLVSKETQKEGENK